MVSRPASALHPIGCACKSCQPAAAPRRRVALARTATRVLVIVAVVLTIPFIVASALSGSKGDRR
ncbi:hypothetical protein [Novosphingobium sp. RL4]|uniref:hypothetical protein n=1 Tax=Novosphingobium sp. RL4 TaxID=3109595 RepID=UPI002D78903E|nr:hypothetical protein [Novosphingobium sp. RL4]WRT94266.1 hypothetical protein U9J33_07150 [Novosphingobium sp. RL4]